jgi:hypothetical protein
MRIAPWWLAGALAALAVPSPVGDRPAPGFRMAAIDDGALGVWEGDRPVLVYNHGVRSKAGVPDDRKRSAYVHPLYGLDGEVLTDDFPKDHYHHRGLFWAWPHVRVGEREYDLWMLRGIRQQFVRWTEKKAGRDGAVLGVENGWYVGDRRVVKEEVRLTVAPADERGRTIDVELRLTALDGPVSLRGADGKGYGGLSLRFAPRTETTVTTADGRPRRDLNLARLGWADLSATFDGRTSGVAVFVRRDHPDYPPAWITREYGFLGVGWPGELRPGREVVLRYRLWVHRGRPGVCEFEEAFAGMR